MEVDAQPSTGPYSRNPVAEREEGFYEPGGEPTEIADLSSQELKDSVLTARKSAWD